MAHFHILIQTICFVCFDIVKNIQLKYVLTLMGMFYFYFGYYFNLYFEYLAEHKDFTRGIYNFI